MRGLISERSYPWAVEPAGLNGSIRERVVCCWILATYADAMYAQGMAGRPWAADECLQRRQDRTQRRLAHACKALAQIRKLLGPNIQINVAEQQVNVMSLRGNPHAGICGDDGTAGARKSSSGALSHRYKSPSMLHLVAAAWVIPSDPVK